MLTEAKREHSTETVLEFSITNSDGFFAIRSRNTWTCKKIWWHLLFFAAVVYGL